MLVLNVTRKCRTPSCAIHITRRTGSNNGNNASAPNPDMGSLINWVYWQHWLCSCTVLWMKFVEVSAFIYDIICTTYNGYLTYAKAPSILCWGHIKSNRVHTWQRTLSSSIHIAFRSPNKGVDHITHLQSTSCLRLISLTLPPHPVTIKASFVGRPAN